LREVAPQSHRPAPRPKKDKRLKKKLQPLDFRNEVVSSDVKIKDLTLLYLCIWQNCFTSYSSRLISNGLEQNSKKN